MSDERIDTVRDQRFWYSYHILAFGQRGPRFDADLLAASLGVTDLEAAAWWNSFTGGYDGVLTKADGQVEQPGFLQLPLDHDGALVVEAHPGDLFVRRHRAKSGQVDLLANFGPHWWIPDWSLTDAVALSGSNAFALLLLAPLVRLAPAADSSVQRPVANAWLHSGLVEAAAATRLAAEWQRCATSGAS